MVDHEAAKLSVGQAKSRLLDLSEDGGAPRPARDFSGLALPAAGAALLLGILAGQRRRRRLGLLGLGALAANPALRRAAVALASTALKRMVRL